MLNLSSTWSWLLYWRVSVCEFVSSCSELSSRVRSLGSSCSVLCQALNLLLRLSLLHSHERIQLVEMSVDGDAGSTHFSPVADHCTVYVSVQKSLNPGSWDLVAVEVYVLEEDNITNQSLFLPGYNESPSCIFLFPDGVVEVEDNSPPGDLMLN